MDIGYIDRIQNVCWEFDLRKRTYWSWKLELFDWYLVSSVNILLIMVRKKVNKVHKSQYIGVDSDSDNYNDDDNSRKVDDLDIDEMFKFKKSRDLNKRSTSHKIHQDNADGEQFTR